MSGRSKCVVLFLTTFAAKSRHHDMSSFTMSCSTRALSFSQKSQIEYSRYCLPECLAHRALFAGFSINDGDPKHML